MLLGGHRAIHGRRTLLVGLVMLAVTAFFVVTSRGSKDFSIVLAIFAVGWLLLIHSHLLRPWLAYKAIERDPNLAASCDIKADHASITMRTGKGTSTLRWSAFPAFIERPELFVLRLGKKQMIVIPKSGFESEEDLARFGEILRSKIAAGR